MKTYRTLVLVAAIAAMFYACNDNTLVIDQDTLLADSLTSAAVFAPPPMRASAESGINKAPLGTAYAQSTFTGYSAANINDGDNNSMVGPTYSWSNAWKYGPDGFLPNWVEIRFDSVITFSRLKLYTSYRYEMSNWTMLAKDTTVSNSWKTLGVVRDNRLNVRTFDFTTPVKATVVRIVGERGPAIQPIYVRVNEIELY